MKQQYNFFLYITFLLWASSLQFVSYVVLNVLHMCDHMSVLTGMITSNHCIYVPSIPVVAFIIIIFSALYLYYVETETRFWRVIFFQFSTSAIICEGWETFLYFIALFYDLNWKMFVYFMNYWKINNCRKAFHSYVYFSMSK